MRKGERWDISEKRESNMTKKDYMIIKEFMFKVQTLLFEAPSKSGS